MKQIIGYIRISTEEQNKSGNGLDAQRKAIVEFATSKGYELLEIVQECASGKLGLDNRPVLREAVVKANKIKAMLVVSKLDRLSRDASFVMNLMNTKLNFCVAELGENVSEFMLHIFCVVAQQEREMISKRTKDALAALKDKGVKLGNERTLKQAQANGHASNASKADEFAAKMKPSIKRMLDAKMNFTQIAKEFNANGVKTARGGQWHPTTVANIVDRYI